MAGFAMIADFLYPERFGLFCESSMKHLFQFCQKVKMCPNELCGSLQQRNQVVGFPVCCNFWIAYLESSKENGFNQSSLQLLYKRKKKEKELNKTAYA